MGQKRSSFEALLDPTCRPIFETMFYIQFATKCIRTHSVTLPNRARRKQWRACTRTKAIELHTTGYFGLLLHFEYNISENDLRVVKNLATRRNMRRTQCVSEYEAKEWPGRPDVLGSVDDEQDISTATSSGEGEQESSFGTTERNRLSLKSLEANWSSLGFLKD